MDLRGQQIHIKCSSLGDTGRYPLVITHAKQVFAYLERLEKLDKENSQALVRHAFKEQENSALDWLSGL